MPLKYTLPLLVWLLLLIGCEKEPAGLDFTEYAWETATAKSQGFSVHILDSAFQLARSKGFIDALLVARNGFLVREEYYNDHSKSTPHNVKSVSKSFLSALTGIALHEGYIGSLDEKVLDYFPEYIYEGMDSRKNQITIRHLLTMRMGIAGESDNNYGVYWELYSSDNWIKKTIEYPLIYTPGERMRYNTFQTHLLSALLTKASGMNTAGLAQNLLTDPMQISIDSWEQDPQGYYFGGNSMHFTPREMAVLGLLYLNSGQLNGLQIIPEDWIEESLQPSTDYGPNNWGTWENYNYASLWWLGQMNGFDMFLAYGYGGQFVACFPDLNLIIVTTANSEVDPDTSTVQEWAIFEIMTACILPSLRDVT